MLQNKKIVAGVVVLAGLGGAIYWAKDKDAQIGTSSAMIAELPDIKAPEDIDKLSITNADKGEIVLEKKDDKWVMTKPVEAPANQTNVDQVVKNLRDLKVKEVISPAPSEESKKTYDFTPTKSVHVVAFKGGEKKLDITFGGSGGRGQMAMIEGKPSIYGVSGYSGYLYTREPKGFRETEIFKFDDQNANGFSIEKKSGKLSFTKEGEKWTGTYRGRPIDRFDEEKVKDAVRALKNLTADDFGDGKTLEETGLDQPESKVTIQLKDNAGTYVLTVGNVASGTSRWVKKDGDEMIYSIPSYTADWVTAEVSKFQKSVDAGKPAPAPAPADDGHGHAH